MSVSIGLMADLDIKTEHLRWMGDTRFVYGFLRGGVFIRPIYTTGPRHTPFLSRSYLAATLSDKDIPYIRSRQGKRKVHEAYQSAWHMQENNGKTC